MNMAEQRWINSESYMQERYAVERRESEELARSEYENYLAESAEEAAHYAKYSKVAQRFAECGFTFAPYDDWYYTWVKDATVVHSEGSKDSWHLNGLPASWEDIRRLLR